MAKTPIDLSPEEEASFKKVLTDRSWCIINAEIPGMRTERVGPIYGAALQWGKDLAERVMPCIIIGNHDWVKGLFFENPNMSQVERFCAVTSSVIFVTDKGYTDEKGQGADKEPLDYEWLQIGPVHSPLFETGYFVVVTDVAEIKDKEDPNTVAIGAKKLIAFKIPKKEAGK